MGPQGEPGKDGVSIVWRGELAAAPASPQLNWAYYNTADKKAYIWNGLEWRTLAQDGATGAAGEDGVSIVWRGEFATAPANPQLNWAYYDTAQKKSFIWNGTAWQVLAQDGKDGVSIMWRGDLAAAPANPQLNWAYYNTADKKAYIWDGSEWRILAQDGVTGSAGNDGISIAWQGECATAPLNPQLNWAYYDITQKRSFIWNGTTWQILAQDGIQGGVGLNSYIVIFNGNGGTPVLDAVGVIDGSTVSMQPNPVREHHSFVGWFTAAEGGTLWNWATPITVNITLYAQWLRGSLTNVAAVSAYLNDLPYNDLNNPHPLPVNIDLGTMTAVGSGWRNLLEAIHGAGKFVALDLSACTMTGTDFSADVIFADGKARIISLVLPDAARSVTGFNSYFTNLSSVSGSEITSIGNNTFYGCTRLSEVSFPVAASIGNYAFYDCTSLESASFPVAESIGSNAFAGCTSLASITFPASATIGSSAFAGCTNLATFTLTGSGVLSTIENGRALVRNSTTLVAYPSASGSVTLAYITSIDNYAFYGCTSLTEASFPAANTINTSAFENCTSLASTSFLVATSIGGNAFKNCTSLTEASFSAVTTIWGGAFAGCTSLAETSFPIANSIGGFTFENCTSLVSVNFPVVESIGNSAFTGCTSLTSVNIPAAASIGSGSFYSCTSLASVTLGVITSGNFNSAAFPGNLRDEYFAAGGGSGTYVRVPSSTTWTKQ